jgi:hypothetical protein
MHVLTCSVWKGADGSTSKLAHHWRPSMNPSNSGSAKTTSRLENLQNPRTHPRFTVLGTAKRMQAPEPVPTAMHASASQSELPNSGTQNPGPGTEAIPNKNFPSALYENAGKWAEPWVARPSSSSLLQDVVPPFGIIGQPFLNRRQERNSIPSVKPTHVLREPFPLHGRITDIANQPRAPSPLRTDQRRTGKRVCLDNARNAMLQEAFYAVLANYDYPGTEWRYPWELVRRLYVPILWLYRGNDTLLTAPWRWWWVTAYFPE